MNRGETLIVGLGETGASVARFLEGQAIPFAAADSRSHPPGCDGFRKRHPQVETRLGEFDERMFLAADRIVLSPGVPLATPAVQKALAAGIPVAGDVELFSRALAERGSGRRPVVAVTGSNGKSTVTTLVADMAARAGRKVAAGGNLGPPVLDLLDDEDEDVLYVLELSSFQLETTYSLKPAASTVLNVSQDHLDRYVSFADYAAAKGRIYHGSRTAVINRSETHGFNLDPASRVVRFGLDAPEEGQFGVLRAAAGPMIARGTEPWLACAALGHLLGDSGVLNAQAALALGCSVDLPREAMLEALRRFKGLPHRLQTLGVLDGVTWINDSKATNVAAAAAALKALKCSCVWIAGGDGKGADFTPLREAAEGRVRAAVLIGRDAERIAAAVSAAISEVCFADDFEGAVAQAYAASRPGDCILLSPACSSLDMFNSYAGRGERFARMFDTLSQPRATKAG